MAIATIPAGLRDILPPEAGELRAIEGSLRDTFSAFGYGEVVVPSFEYYDSLATETGERFRRQMFKFFDQDGRIVALRPELTTPIARLAAQRLRESELPLRLYYSQNVFRQQPPQRGQQREFKQAGVELIGEAGAAADAEIVTMMVESLSRCGLQRFKIGVGQIGFVQGIIDELDDKVSKDEIREALLAKDLVRLTALTEDLGEAGKALRSLSNLRGEAVFDEASKFATNARSTEALSNLSKIISLVGAAGLSDWVVPDLGIVRNFDYYTGAIFEGFAEGLGFPLSGGGRYDTLTATFGWPQPATGFQHGVERLHIALSLENSVSAVPQSPTLITGTQNKDVLFAVAASLRAAGLSTRMTFADSSAEDARKKAAELGCIVVFADASGTAAVFSPGGDSSRGVALDQVAGAVEKFSVQLGAAL